MNSTSNVCVSDAASLASRASLLVSRRLGGIFSDRTGESYSDEARLYFFGGGLNLLVRLRQSSRAVRDDGIREKGQ